MYSKGSRYSTRLAAGDFFQLLAVQLHVGQLRQVRLGFVFGNGKSSASANAISSSAVLHCTAFMICSFVISFLLTAMTGTSLP